MIVVDEIELLSVIKLRIEKEKPNAKLIKLSEEIITGIQMGDKEFNIKSVIESIECEEDIEDILKISKTKDDGGIIAMTGFYFQFLVSIEYLIELMKGKWTHLVIDQHQDIIVFNKDCIRFIQVKTKNTPHIEIGSTKAHKEWIPKLLMMQKMFEGYNVDFQYELVTNFILDNSPRAVTNIEGYLHNNEFHNGEKNGSLFNYIQKNSLGTEQFKYLTPDKLEKSLNNFKLTKKNIEDYSMKICCEIGELFYQNAKARQEDLDYIIGYLIEKCYYPKDKSVQIIDNRKAMILKEELRKRVAEPLEREVKEKQSGKIINDFVKSINLEYTESLIKEDFLLEVSNFEKELSRNFDNSKSETIFSMISKFSEKKYSSNEYNSMEESVVFSEVERLLKVMVYVKIHYGGTLCIDLNSNNLLIMEIGNEPLNFYAVRDTYKLEEAINEFKDIFQSLSTAEQYHIISKPKLKIIMSGDYINDDYEAGMTIEIENSEKPESKKINFGENQSSKSIAKVQNSFQIIDGYDNKIGNIHKRRKLYKDMSELKEKILGELGL